MKLEKHTVQFPIYWPRLEGNKGHLVRSLLPTPGNVLFTLLVVGGLLWATSAGALPFRAPTLTGDSTTTISYQGRLADSSGNPVTTSGVGMQFRLYNTDTGGSPLWEESHTAVPVEDGLFHALLGSTDPIPVSLLADHSTLWLGITVGADSEMTPREQIASVPYAMIASTVPDGAITQAKAPFAVKGDLNDMRIERGQVIAALSSEQVGSVTINFNSPFNNPPQVYLQIDGAGLNWGWDYTAITDSCGTDSCTVRYKYLPGATTETALRIKWLAIGQ